MADSYSTVPKEDFDAFVAAYPHPLVKDCCGIPEPPVLSYNDFRLGVWPASVVARVTLCDWDPSRTPEFPPTKGAWYEYQIKREVVRG